MKLLLLYRVLAYVTGVLLVCLVFVAVPLQLAGNDALEKILGFAHGWLYMVYVLVTLLLSLRQRWSILMTILVAAAGTIPFAAFFAEHRVVKLADEKAAAPPKGATASSSAEG